MTATAVFYVVVTTGTLAAATAYWLRKKKRKNLQQLVECMLAAATLTSGLWMILSAYFTWMAGALNNSFVFVLAGVAIVWVGGGLLRKALK